MMDLRDDERVPRGSGTDVERGDAAFILIDPITNNTSAVGMILKLLDESALENDLVPVLNLNKLGIAKEHYEAIETAVKELARQGLEIKIIK
jgi:sulfate adenylyltransferase subunit 1